MTHSEDGLTKDIEYLARLYGRESLIFADELDKLAVDRENSGLIHQAEFLYMSSLDVRRRQYGKDHPGIVKSLNHLGRLYSRQGDHKKAEEHYIQALAIRRRRLGPTHGKTLRSIIYLANTYERQGLFGKVEELLVNGLEIARGESGRDHSETAKFFTYLADLYAKQNLWEKAKYHYIKALDIKRSAFGRNHLRTIRYVNNLARFCAQQGLYKEAETHYQEALRIRRNALGYDHPFIIKSLSRLADNYVKQGLYRQAQLLCLEALYIDEKNSGVESPKVIQSLNRLASVYASQGFYSRAKPLHERALAICRARLKTSNPDFVASLHNLADTCECQGLYHKARILYSEALAISQKEFGSDHPDCAKSLNRLALLYARQGLYEHAEVYCSDALAITRRARGSRHINTARSLNNLASLYRRRNLHDKAGRLYLKSLVITCKTFGSHHHEVATILNDLALLHQQQGHYEIAERLYERSQLILKDTLGMEHRATADCLNNLANLYSQQKLYKKAEPLFREALMAHLALLQREAPYLSKSERLSFLTSFGLANEVIYSYAIPCLITARLALFARLNCQGLLERIEGRQTQLASAHRRYRGLQLEVEQVLRALVQKLASKALLPEERAELKVRQEELEHQLYRLLPQLKLSVVEVEEVASAMPTNSSLVELQRYQPMEESNLQDPCSSEPRFLALILKPDRSVKAVDLGPAAAIEAGIEEARNQTIQCFADSSSPWKSISERILSPLLPHLEGAKLLIFSLDGELHRIPFTVLPLPKQPDQLLVDAVSLRLVSSGRDLLDHPFTSERTAPAGSVLVVADPAFDLDPGASSPEDPDSSAPQLRSRDMQIFHSWEPLPGTAKEGREVAELLDAQLLTGSEATTLAIQKAHRPRILHIATHGFFLPDQAEQLQVQPWLSLDRPDLVASFSGEDPMLRSGLVFAGANHPGTDPDEDDGYLTAMEAVHLDLRGTELVTLSACDSGSGDIHTGEGVYGLQRAFIVAGARSLLLSLWPVPDDATCAFMFRFYTFLKEGFGRYEALTSVQREFREHENIVWRHPYYWGAWQLIGDGRPIEGL